MATTPVHKGTHCLPEIWQLQEREKDFRNYIGR